MNEISIHMPRGQRMMVTVSIMLATIMQTIDTTIANVALPHMQGAVSATQDQISWVLTSYIVAAAIMTPPTAILAKWLGRKNLFIVAIIGFTISSMLCGISENLTEMVGARLLQGVFGACLVPLSQTVILDMYPTEKQGQAMAWWGVGVMVGPILGPTLGGYLTDMYSWRWVFFINVPLGILAFFGMTTFLPNSNRGNAGRFDIMGFAMLSLAIGSLQMMLDRGQSQDWFSSREIIIELVLTILFSYLFIVHMFTTKKPFIEPSLFRDRNLASGLVLAFVLGIIMLATMALLPPLLQTLIGYSVVTTGNVMAPRGAGTMVAMLIVGRMIGRVDARYLILFGLSLTALSLWQMSEWNLNIGPWDIIYTGIIQGFGMGFIFIPMSTVIFSTLKPELRTEGSSMYSLTRNIGSSIGISIMMSMLIQHTQEYHSILAETINPFRQGLDIPQIWNWRYSQGLAAINAEVTRQAAAIAYLADFKIMMWVTICGAPLLIFMRQPKQSELATAEPINAEPGGIEPVRADPIRAEPISAEP